MITPAELSRLKELTERVVRDQAHENWRAIIGCDNKLFCDDMEFYWEACPYDCEDGHCEGHFPPGQTPYWIHGPNWVQHHSSELYFPQDLAEWIVLARNLLPEILRQHEIYQRNTVNLTMAIRDIASALQAEDDDDWE